MRNSPKDSSASSETKARKSSFLGSDGKPMSTWQIWLRRLCLVVIVWAIFELVLGIAAWVAVPFLAEIQFDDMNLSALVPLLGTSTLVGGALDLTIGLLGFRGSKNPCKITLFFWITLADAVLTSWAMASNVSAGLIDPVSIISGLFIIALAVCAWQVRGQTGYFEEHP